MFKNLIECFRAKEKRQKIKMTLKNAIERLRMPKDAKGTVKMNRIGTVMAQKPCIFTVILSKFEVYF
jgi:hypothetical protein